MTVPTALLTEFFSVGPEPDIKPDQRLRLVAVVYHSLDGSRLL
jgi:hypothetical protein